MNERIVRLIDQMDQSGIPYQAGDNLMTITDRYLEKFAELIIKETCDRIEREYKYALGEKTQWAMSQDVQDLIKEHFGVEE